MKFFDVYAKWFEQQNPEVQAIMIRLFEKHEGMYISNTTGKVKVL